MRERVPPACGKAAPPVAPSARKMRNRGTGAGFAPGRAAEPGAGVPLPPPVGAATPRARAVNPDLPTGVRGENKLSGFTQE